MNKQVRQRGFVSDRAQNPRNIQSNRLHKICNRYTNVCVRDNVSQAIPEAVRNTNKKYENFVSISLYIKFLLIKFLNALNLN